MTEWTPWHPSSGRIPSPDRETVRAHPSGNITLSTDIVQQLGNPERIQFLTNESGDHIGLRALPSNVIGGGYKLLRYPSQTTGREAGARRAINANQILWALGRRGAVLSLPHHFDGDVLVIDISGLPTRPKRGA